jgi:hypothetical protein
MSSQAGAVNSNDGVGLFGVRVTPLEGLKIDVSNQYGVNHLQYYLRRGPVPPCR